MQLILHIGTEKTGTTLIQNTLSSERRALIEKGILFPRSLGSSNCIHLPMMFANSLTIDAFYSRNNIKTRSQFMAWQAKTKRWFQNELIKKPSKQVIISSEHLQSCLTTKAEIQHLKDFLVPLFSDIQIIVYLREPLDAAVSRWSTQIKCAVPVNNLPNPSSDKRLMRICNHQNTLEMWSGVFGQSNVIPRLYDQKSFKGGSLITDFWFILRQLGLDHELFSQPQGITVTDSTNKSLSYFNMLILNKIAALEHFSSNRRMYAIYKELVAYLIENPHDRDTGQHYCPDNSEHERYELTFAPSNDWIRNNYFVKSASLWPSASAFDSAKRRSFVEYLMDIEDFTNEYSRQLMRIVKDYVNLCIGKEDMNSNSFKNDDFAEYLRFRLSEKSSF